jgi:hypothetical protein
MSSKDTDFQMISKAIMKTYQDQMHEYLNSKKDGELTDADVIVMIMNLSVGISTSIYYTLKQILPSTNLDFDYMKAKMCNTLVDDFEKIKQYNPKDTMVSLTVEQVNEIKEKGFAMIPLHDGSVIKVSMDEIMVKRDDADKLLEEAKEKAKDIVNTPKIITSSNGFLRK